ncbi:hypothetical protein AQ490_07500 [Wenjunlia vitaminophila]|uniref:Murein biosynthesis integral membrane protein MurJ n=1 Tax=Wenjunlia vitaminophila TaxID=76728 RepID=A0A0T6LMK8_WENVI|nr:murein biosynthesis integral membrane protein MurJ [Wenjunlia vitaminophila]KRV47307.1 hypothetical protein AQ490_07500 [Wenjunlia vitaminophila]
MNAPYDGERDREAEEGQVPPPSSHRGAPRDPRQGYADPGYGYPQDPYQQQGHYPHAGQDDQGYPSPGYQADGYAGSGYGDQQYPNQGHPDGGYQGDPYQGGGYQDGGYQDGGYQGQADPGYQAQGYPSSGYGDQQYPNQGHPDGGYPAQGAGQAQHGADPYAQDPYAAGSAHGGYDPYAQDPHQGYPQGGDPRLGYAQSSGGWQDPYQGYYQQGYAQDPHLTDTYIGDTLYGQIPPVPDPLSSALYDRSAQSQSRRSGSRRRDPQADPRYADGWAGAPGYGQPQQGGYPDQAPYQQPGQVGHPQQYQGHPQPDPRLYAPTPEPEPSGAVDRRLPHGDQDAAGYVGVDEFLSGPDDRERDAYAHLFRDERVPPGRPPGGTRAAPRRQAPPPPPPAAGGKSGGVLKSSALMAAGTMVSRVTGFLRTLVIAAAIGLASLGDIYQVANVLPTMVYILTIGGGLNSVFVPQLVRAMRNDEDGGLAYANRLLTLVMVILGAIVAVTVLAAPLLIKAMSAEIANDEVKLDVAVTFARYCLPTIFFMGVHVVMGQILNARGRFGAMMWTPVLNNIVMIFTFGMFIWVFGSFSSTEMGAETISPEGVRLLGIGTLLGLAVQALAMLPYLRDAGFTFRPRFDWRGHGLGHAAKLAKWTFLFVLANQVGLIVVTQLATVAGSTAEREGNPGTGITAYQNAQLIWQMPQAIITVSVMAAVLPRISRAAADGDRQAVRDDISYGLRTSAVAIVPAAFSFLALGVPMSTLMYSSAGDAGARSIGYILMAFGLGLIPFSVQYVVLRGFYAYEDTRTPFFNTVIVAASMAALSGLCYLVLPSRWVVTGMAASYGIAYVIGVRVAVVRLRDRLGGDMDGPHIVRTYARLIGACLPSAACAGGVAYLVLGALGNGVLGSTAALLAGGTVLLVLFFMIGKRMRIEEMTALVGMVRSKLGR